MKLKHACIDSGQYGVNASPDSYRFSGIRMIRTSDLTDGGLRPTEDGVYLEGPVPDIQRLRTGDILLSRAGTIGRSYLVPPEAEDETFAGFLIRFRPKQKQDARFLAYVSRSSPFQDQISAEAVSSTIQNFNADRYANLEIPEVVPEEQRRIADFLDERVALIEQVISARQKRAELSQERLKSALQDLVSNNAAGETRSLQDFTDPGRPIQYGIVLPGPDFDGGVPIVKGGDIGSGRLRRLELSRTDPQIEAKYLRSRVHPGDFVIAIRGSVGEIDHMPDQLEVANLTQDSARIAPHGCDPWWLLAVLESHAVQSEMQSLMTGSTVRGINIESLRRVRVPVADDEGQMVVGREAAKLRGVGKRLRTDLQRSIALLQEYKQSLITAAVAGQFDVTTASTRIPE